MVNILTLALTHALMALAAIRLLMRDDLDDDGKLDAGREENPKPWLDARRQLEAERAGQAARAGSDDA